MQAVLSRVACAVPLGLRLINFPQRHRRLRHGNARKSDQQDGLPLAVQNAAGAPAISGMGETGMGGGGGIVTAPHQDVGLRPAFGRQGAMRSWSSSAARSLRSRVSSAGRSCPSSHKAKAITQPVATASKMSSALCLLNRRSFASPLAACTPAASACTGTRPARAASTPVAARTAAPSMILVATFPSSCSCDCACARFEAYGLTARPGNTKGVGTKFFRPGGRP